MDRVDQFGDFDPRKHYALTLAPAELTEGKRSASVPHSPGARRAADIELDLP